MKLWEVILYDIYDIYIYIYLLSVCQKFIISTIMPQTNITRESPKTKLPQTGKIKSQRQPSQIQSRLIKQYNDYNTDRITALKHKYNEPLKIHSINNTQHSRIPLSQILNTQQKSRQIQIKQNLRSYICEVTKNIYEWREGKVQDQIVGFQRQVGMVNMGISSRLEELEERIREFKEKARREKQIRQLRYTIKQEQQARIQAINQQIKKLTNQNIEQSLKTNQTHQNETPYKAIQNHEQSFLMKMSHLQNHSHLRIPQTLQLPQINHTQFVEQSCIALKGQVQQGKQFTKQFTYFINRVKDQIKLDRRLTKLLLAIRPEILVNMKIYIKKYHPRTDVSQFQISPIQRDPLQTPSYLQIPISQIQQLGEQCYHMYKQILDHFHCKLHRKFGKQTLDMFFEELGSSEVSIGHIISYINMRTEEDFRNRDLVKLLRRINICTNFVDKVAFYENFGV